MIKDRQEIIRRYGNTYESISLNAKLEKSIQNLTNLHTEFKKAVVLHKTVIHKNDTAKVNDEVSTIEMQVKECIDLHMNASSYHASDIKTYTDFINQMSTANVKPPECFDSGNGSWRTPSAAEIALVKRWAEENKKIDANLLKIGDELDKINDIMSSIDDKTKKQKNLIKVIGRHTEEVAKEIQDINSRLAKFANESTSFNLTLKVILTILFIILLFSIIKLGLSKFSHATSKTPETTKQFYENEHLKYIIDKMINDRMILL